MLDREKVIKGLEYHMEELGVGKTCFECPYFGDNPCEILLIEDVLELLKEQEPIKPTVSVDTWICSKCGHTLESQELIDDKENPQVLIHEQYQYCPNCGKAVKWE